MTKILIDPYKVTNFKRSQNELEEFLLFCIVVAGKTAYIQSRKLDEFLASIKIRLMMPENINPFQIIKSAEQHGILMEEILRAKLGQYKKLFAGFKYISDNKLVLNNTTKCC
jgi:hypothetical protein